MPEARSQERKLRADAQRNRERLVEVARKAFERNGANASLDEIAKQAGIGSGTLYRHFPTREALIEAVYAQEVAELGKLGEELVGSAHPLEALRTWLSTFVDHIVEKQIIASALSETAYASARTVIFRAVERLTRRAVDSGDLRPDTMAVDLLRALIGVLRDARDVDAQNTARRLVPLLLRGASVGIGGRADGPAA